MADDKSQSVPESACESNGRPAGPDAMADAVRRLAEARDYAVYFVAAETERIKLKVRRVLLWVAAGVVAALLVVTVLVTATALLLWSIASVISNALDEELWVGALITGGGILLLTGLTTWIGLWAWKSSGFRATRRRFERRRDRQRQTFGRDVETQSRSSYNSSQAP